MCIHLTEDRSPSIWRSAASEGDVHGAVREGDTSLTSQISQFIPPDPWVTDVTSGLLHLLFT